ncbi:MAG: redoxin domain-containing protein [Deltaproteobacteria bacterium]|nr:redoxin domain-containing protein [Deltaproteobacteria bacterium]
MSRALAILATSAAVAGCADEGGGPATPCTQLNCELGSLSCCVPASPGVWDPAGGTCVCPPPDDPDADADADAAADADADTDTDATAEADPDAEPEADAGDDDGGTVDERGPYPPGPYGLDVGDVMKNYSFLTSSGRISLQDVRLDRAHTILFVYLGSASCAYCSTETPELNVLYTDWEPRGLEILGVLADDDLGPPTGASADEYFRDGYGAEYPYGANEWAAGTLMSDLFPDGNVGLPENFILDLDTMRIRERMDGYPDSGGLEPFIDRYL